MQAHRVERLAIGRDQDRVTRDGRRKEHGHGRQAEQELGVEPSRPATRARQELTRDARGQSRALDRDRDRHTADQEEDDGKREAAEDLGGSQAGHRAEQHQREQRRHAERRGVERPQERHRAGDAEHGLPGAIEAGGRRQDTTRGEQKRRRHPDRSP